MICLMLECFLEFLDVFKTIMLMCFPSWCIWHLSCFLWKRSMRPLLYRILSSDLFFRYTVIYHEYSRWSVTYPPSSHMTVEETKTFCQQGYLSQVIKIPGFLKTLILKKYGYFKNLLYGDRNEIEQRSRANSREKRSRAKPWKRRSRANPREKRSRANEVEQRSGANEVEQRSGANEVEQRSRANEVEQRSRANEVEQRSRANPREQRSQLNQWEQKSRSNQWEQITFQYQLNQPTRAALDTLTYRQGYPGKEDNIHLCENWLFYSNNKRGRNGMSIDQVHDVWYGNYSLLETCHDFIQWLFPIRELSMYNHQAQELQLHEAKSIIEDPAARQRVLKSYHMMLDFWGMSLEDEKTGVIVRGDNWEERFRNLNRSSHNYLRITRMLKSLGELGFEHLKFPFLSFILCEVFLEQTLVNASESCRHYWIYLLRDEEESGKIRETALEYLG
ncbi:uncharacterized protein [Asterias amurensis]|uniref:uncharacterized protein n=1 Tax=Asterias amurensis TaxID=7602 RepID=UPI003AB14163